MSNWRGLGRGGATRTAITATLATLVGLMAASTLGVATAEAPTTPPQRTVSVQGVAEETIRQGASAATATAVYHQGIADAVTDGRGKAQLLAGKVGAVLGPATSVVEDGGYISCIASDESGYAEYQGAQPDFGSAAGSGPVSPLRAGAVAPAQKALGAPRKPAVKRHKRGRRPTAKKATVPICTLSARVSLAYALG